MADNLIRIPMAGKVESLNAAIATGILMYEYARQEERQPINILKIKNIIKKHA